jgi:hypothetical protein
MDWQLHSSSKQMPLKLGVSFVMAAWLCRASGPAAGRWEGQVQIPGRELRLVIDLAQDNSGRWVGSAIVPGLGIKGAALTGIAVTDLDISFGIKGALGGPKFKGRIAANGSLSGDYQQAGNTAGFSLQKTGAAQVEPQRESTPVRTEVEGEWQGTMNYLGNEIHVRLKFMNQPDGKAIGQFVIVGNEDAVFTIDLITQEADVLTLELVEIGVTYEGSYRDDVREITGTFHQGAMDIPLNVHPVKRP